MRRPWPIIAVADVTESSSWYMRLLAAQQNHPGATVFNQILDGDGTILVCPHRWGPSGPRGDHEWPSLMTPAEGRAGNGLLLWFVVHDFDAAGSARRPWERPSTSIRTRTTALGCVHSLSVIQTGIT